VTNKLKNQVRLSDPPL